MRVTRSVSSVQSEGCTVVDMNTDESQPVITCFFFSQGGVGVILNVNVVRFLQTELDNAVYLHQLIFLSCFCYEDLIDRGISPFFIKY